MCLFDEMFIVGIHMYLWIYQYCVPKYLREPRIAIRLPHSVVLTRHLLTK